MTRWGQNAGHQRYRCNKCKRPCNALSGTPLAHFRIREKLDAYLASMDGGSTLRPAAAECDVSLKTSFYLRHRLMAVIEADTTGQLSGISEMDETFFRESRKGQRGLGKGPVNVAVVPEERQTGRSFWGKAKTHKKGPCYGGLRSPATYDGRGS